MFQEIPSPRIKYCFFQFFKTCEMLCVYSYLRCNSGKKPFRPTNKTGLSAKTRSAEILLSPDFKLFSVLHVKIIF